MVVAARRSLLGQAQARDVHVKVGSFAKSTGAAPAAQAITGLGWAPQPGHFALLLWTSGGTADGTIRTHASGDARACIGIVSGTAAAEQYAVSTTADSAGVGGRRATQKAFLLSDATGVTVVSEASLTSLDPDGFTLTWSTNSVTEAQIIHYLALGGGDVQAKVKHYVGPAGLGAYATTGVGFQPNVLFNIGTLSTGLLDGGSGAVSSVIIRAGAAAGTSSWGQCVFGTQIASAAAWRVRRTDGPLMVVISTAGAVTHEQTLVSMDADGFTLNNVVGASAVFGMLCLKVPRAAAGTIVKPTGGGPAAVSAGITFPPECVLLASVQDVNRANAPSQTGARHGLSAFTASAAESSVLSVPDAANPIAYAALEKSGKAAVKIDNATPAIDAECTGALDGAGFTLTWNANDAVATEYGYVAIGA